MLLWCNVSLLHTVDIQCNTIEFFVFVLDVGHSLSYVDFYGLNIRILGIHTRV